MYKLYTNVYEWWYGKVKAPVNEEEAPVNMNEETPVNMNEETPVKEEAPVNEEEEPCFVCYEPLSSKPKMELNCGHYMHTECGVLWLTKKANCPLCRGAVPLKNGSLYTTNFSSEPFFNGPYVMKSGSNRSGYARIKCDY